MGSLRVLMVAVEMAPWIKVGGLGDVLGALPGALAGAGVRVTVVLPLVEPLRATLGGAEPLPGGAFEERLGPRTYGVVLRRATHPSGVPVVLVDAPGLLDRQPYLDPRTGSPYADQLHRWAVLSRGALRAAAALGGPWDVVHAHDAHAALTLAYHRWGEAAPDVAAATRVLSIHNIGYPGIFPLDQVGELGLPVEETYPMGPLEYWGDLNLLKAGMVCARGIHTVSPTYAAEVMADPSLGYGLSGLMAARRADVVGILNGIDDAVWDPAADEHLPAAYDADDLSGKAACKAALVRELGWPAEAARDPLIVSVSRLVWQKGSDALADAVPALLDLGARVAVLGTGEPALEARWRELARAHPGRVAALIRFDEGLAHRFEAGADLFVMPSRYEPCGLNQMYSMRYGTVPVVRRTGGLADTVVDVAEDPERGTGFLFEHADANAVVWAVGRALQAMGEPEGWRTLQRRGMVCDWSWRAVAARYVDWYHGLLAPGA